MDDTNLLAYGTTTEKDCKVLEKAHRKCLKWAQKHGASFAPKYKHIHLTRSPKKVNMEATVNLGSYQIPLEVELKIFRTLDRWEAQVVSTYLKKVQAKMAFQTVALTKVGTSTWGAILSKAGQVHSAIVRPAMTYAAPVWHTPQQKGPGSAAKSNPLAE